MIDEIIDIVSPSMAGVHQRALEALIRGDREYPELVGIAIDDEIPTLSEEELRKTLNMQMQNWYFKQLKKITADSSIPYKKKSWLIRKIKTDILPRLKRGELVVYESDFTI